MKVLLQRVARARVATSGAEVAAIGRGLLLFVAVERGDTDATAAVAATKVARLRVFADEAGRMNLDLGEAGGEALVVSQFTLAASLARGRRPSFDGAADPEIARRLVDRFADALASSGIATRRGVFRADMQVELVNDGPVTFLLEVGGGADPTRSD